jgi:hypothetical protein
VGNYCTHMIRAGCALNATYVKNMLWCQPHAQLSTAASGRIVIHSEGGGACPAADGCVVVTLCSSAPTPDSRPDTSVVSAKEDSLLSSSGPNGQAGAYQSGNYRWVWHAHATLWRQGLIHQPVPGAVHRSVPSCCTLLQQHRLQR